MNYLELNNYLREKMLELIEKGHKKTVIGKLLLGANGYAPILKFLENADDAISFGVKPLSRIGEVIDYDLKLVYVKKDNTELIEEIYNQNTIFAEELKEAIDDYLVKDIGDKLKTPGKPKSKETCSVIDNLLNEIIND